MKKILLIVSVIICSISASAQLSTEEIVVIANEDSCKTERIQAVIDACLMLAQSSESGDSVALAQSANALKECNVANFGVLRPIDKENGGSLKGHLVFDEKFAESLAQGEDAYAQADNFNRARTHRGQMTDGKILTKTCLVKANSKSTYKFPSSGYQELAVVAAPGGLVSTRIHVTNKKTGLDQWHNDTADVKKGRNYRKTSFTLPKTPNSIVELEITNCTPNDFTVVVISN